MTVEVRTFSNPSRSHPPRKLRNFLLEPRFQLKYSGMVIAVTVAVASVLGYQAYRYSTGQTQMMNIQLLDAKGAAADAHFIAYLERSAKEADHQIWVRILSGIGMLALALGLTGIVVTHRVVGPAYRLKQMIHAVGEGRLQPSSSIRKHDELRDLFVAFTDMLKRLRGSREQELKLLDEALEQARASGLPESALAALRGLRERMQRSLE